MCERCDSSITFEPFDAWYKFPDRTYDSDGSFNDIGEYTFNGFTWDPDLKKTVFYKETRPTGSKTKACYKK